MSVGGVRGAGAATVDVVAFDIDEDQDPDPEVDAGEPPQKAAVKDKIYEIPVEEGTMI